MAPVAPTVLALQAKHVAQCLSELAYHARQNTLDADDSMALCEAHARAAETLAGLVRAAFANLATKRADAATMRQVEVRA